MLAMPASRLTACSAGNAGPVAPNASQAQRAKATIGRYKGWKGSRVL